MWKPCECYATDYAQCIFWLYRMSIDNISTSINKCCLIVSRLNETSSQNFTAYDNRLQLWWFRCFVNLLYWSYFFNLIYNSVSFSLAFQKSRKKYRLVFSVFKFWILKEIRAKTIWFEVLQLCCIIWALMSHWLSHKISRTLTWNL